MSLHILKKKKERKKKSVGDAHFCSKHILAHREIMLNQSEVLILLYLNIFLIMCFSNRLRATLIEVTQNNQF